jgi:DNA repair exonuclease SbcCD ATPase subunit
MEEPSLIVATSTAEDCNDASATVDAVDLAEAVDVEPGQVRFQGNFQGVATTHTHQIDLSMGFDVEVPSSMAADAMKQIESRGRSFSPHDRFPALRDRAETAPEPASIWRSLGSFFRRDARDSQRNEEQRRRSLSRGSAGYKLKIADQEARTQALTEELDASSGQVAQFEARINELEEEKYLLADQLEALRQEYAEQLLQSPNEDMGTAANEALAAAQHHVVMLTSQLAEAELAQTQVEASRQTLEQENKGLAQQVEELERRLHHELMDKANTTGSLRGDLAASEARTAQAEASAEAAHSAARELQEQKRSLEIEFERLQTHAAGINAKAELLERAQEANSVMNQDLSSQAEAHMGSMGADDALKIQTQLAYLEQANAELELQLTRSLELQNQESTRACDLDRLVNALKAEIGAAERAANFNKDASERCCAKQSRN